MRDSTRGRCNLASLELLDLRATKIRIPAQNAVVVCRVADRDTDHGQVEPVADPDQERHVTVRVGNLYAIVGQRGVHLAAAGERHPVDLEPEHRVVGFLGL